MTFELTNGVHFCIANNQLTFLNLNTGRYSALAQPGEAAFRKLIAGEVLGDDDRRFLGSLESSGILRSATNSVRPAPPSVPAARQDVSFKPVGFVPVMTFRAVAAQIRTRLQFKGHSIGEVLAKGACRRSVLTSGKAPTVDVRIAALAFQRTRLLLTTQDQCLTWSLSIMHYLAEFCIPATLILGVRRTPWSAHAWVQIEETVLSDSLENVIPYTPILVV